ncbi:MAG TPA: DUF1549 domain-containing protein [Gemmataceae bacterium]|jgi:hypothetical protein
MFSLSILMVGLGVGAPPETPAELAAWIDARLESARQAKGLPRPEPAGDDVFLRRAYLDLAGTIPSVAEARDFLESASATKRLLLVQSLIDDKRFPEHFAGLWARTLAPAGNTRGPLENWLRGEFRKNTPFDQVTRALLTASGDATGASPASFYFAVGNSPERVAEAIGRGLLGVRLGCAQCHDHPLAEWKREDFWGLAAFFAGTGTSPRQIGDGFAVRVTATGGSKEYDAKFLDGPPPQFSAGRSPRAVLADWLAAPRNRFFAANVVNRVWQDLCGTGLVSTVDDLDTVTAQERALILDELAGKFAAGGFNLRWLVEGICLSKAYQQASAADAPPGTFRRPVRTLSPEQVFAALDQSLSLKKGRTLSPRFTSEGRTLQAQLDSARGTSPTDYKAGIPQALLLMNGSLITKATTLDDSMTLRAVVDAPFLDEGEKLETLFLAAYSRLPRADERERFLKVVTASRDAEARKQAYANVFWALLNSPEFVLCP